MKKERYKFALASYIVGRGNVNEALEESRKSLGVPYKYSALAVIGLLNLGVGDSFAGLIGSYIGKKHYVIGNVKISFEGSFIMFIMSFITTYLLIYFAGLSLFPKGLIAVVIISVGATLLEAVSGNGLDNLSIPLGSAVLFSWFYL